MFLYYLRDTTQHLVLEWLFSHLVL
jgi:hypothetical protein